MNFKKKNRKVEIDEIDITSLLDILVILLVFLLKSFNDSELTVDLVNELAIPYSMSRVAANDGVVLQVNKKRNVFVNTSIIGNLESPKTLQDTKIKLLNEYKMRFGKDVLKPGDEDKVRLINFVFDKGLKYSDINSIMNISSDAGFGKYKFIIQGEE